MTLPFRRRHHDGESGHDRARTLISDGLLGQLPVDEAAWLTHHLDSCAECRTDRAAFQTDQALLRGLREQAPEPPRDLWARTSAALDREAGRRGQATPAPGGGGTARGGWRALPLGAAASVLVLAVAIGAVVIPGIGPTATAAPGGSTVGVLPTPAPTGIAVPQTEPLVVFRETTAGTWELVYSDVTEVCAEDNPDCAPKPDEKTQSVDLGDRPSELTMSPTRGELVIASASERDKTGQVLVVPVAEPGATPDPTVFVTEPPAVTDPPVSPPSSEPPSSESPEPASPTPAATPPGAIAIATGVRLVGDVAYSDDGQWLAFSAEPVDGSTGPDLYLWSVDEPTATAVTDDHRTYFSSWHDGQVLASRVELDEEPIDPAASAEPGASGDPATPTDEPANRGEGNGGQGNGGEGNGGGPDRTEPPAATEPPSSPEPTASDSPGQSSGAPTEARAVSFLMDPASLEVTDLARADVWLPVLDPRGRAVVYWSGTLVSDDGRTWALGTGDLVLDGWSDEVEAPDASVGPEESASPQTTAPGPVGTPTILVEGDKATFEASFGPVGDHLAIWVGEAVDDEVGRLHLVVIDPETATVSNDSPLVGARALRRFAIDSGRLAWVTPSGQDGQDSAVKVLGWKGDDFGEIEPQSGSDLYIVP